MANKGKIIIFSLVGIFLAIVLFLIYQIKKLSSVTFDFSGYKLTNISLEKAKIRVYMKVTNDSLLSVVVTRQNYSAYLNNNFISKITNNADFYLKPGVSYMPLDIEIKLSDAIKAGATNILDLLGSMKNSNIIIKGTYELKLGAFSVRDLEFSDKFNLGESLKK